MKIAKTSTSLSKLSFFYLFWPCPATSRKQFSGENSWNHLNNRTKLSLILTLQRKSNSVAVMAGWGRMEWYITKMAGSETTIIRLPIISFFHIFITMSVCMNPYSGNWQISKQLFYDEYANPQSGMKIGRSNKNLA
jgi:hypothetical protein